MLLICQRPVSSASLVVHLLGIEAHERRAGGDLLALDHVDLGDAPAVRMIDHLDPIGRLDLALGAHHLLDLGQRRPREQAAEHQRRPPRSAGPRPASAGARPRPRHRAGTRPADGRRRSAPTACRSMAQTGAGRGRVGYSGGCRPRTKLAISPGVPSRSIRPSTRNSTRSAIASAPRRWVTMTTVRPRDAPLEVGQQRLLGQAVERAGRLVEHQQARVADQRAGDADQLALAGGEAAAALAERGCRSRWAGAG